MANRCQVCGKKITGYELICVICSLWQDQVEDDLDFKAHSVPTPQFQVIGFTPINPNYFVKDEGRISDFC